MCVTVHQPTYHNVYVFPNTCEITRAILNCSLHSPKMHCIFSSIIIATVLLLFRRKREKTLDELHGERYSCLTNHIHMICYLIIIISPGDIPLGPRSNSCKRSSTLCSDLIALCQMILTFTGRHLKSAVAMPAVSGHSHADVLLPALSHCSVSGVVPINYTSCRK